MLLCFSGLDILEATPSAHIITPSLSPIPASDSPFQPTLLLDLYTSPTLSFQTPSRYIHSLSASDYSLNKDLLCAHVCVYSKGDTGYEKVQSWFSGGLRSRDPSLLFSFKLSSSSPLPEKFPWLTISSANNLNHRHEDLSSSIGYCAHFNSSVHPVFLIIIEVSP